MCGTGKREARRQGKEKEQTHWRRWAATSEQVEVHRHLRRHGIVCESTHFMRCKYIARICPAAHRYPFVDNPEDGKALVRLLS